MSESRLEIMACPPNQIHEAVALVLSALAPEQRREIAASLKGGCERDFGLFIGCRKGVLRGACWGQLHPGNTAVLWPPQWSRDEDRAASALLAQHVTCWLDEQGVGLTQVLLATPECESAAPLEAAGFYHLADLLYFSSERGTFPKRPPLPCDIELSIYRPDDRPQWERLIERTYEGTLDCSELNGVRSIEDVVSGYAATGISGTSLWYEVRAKGEAIGVLMLAEHPNPKYWELVYLGLVPEARGHRWGTQVVRNAQWMANLSNVERIVLAVDASNKPALDVYENCGFLAWDRRSVFVRPHRAVNLPN